ncbi:helix-turn-helix domain-containing protein [Microbacterium sp.]|jgi:AcrR family transcriptional regulator|uniref:TetR/AcrR family transcriptional regulator n=1 Tax=Microbacterium sp. TaxID=51671 RepID=UPI002D0120E1|nr:helix-turn-helix domain-containing protein [Microbacterium sp.]HWL77496.1 helix-turn-helix domain-containing protein [Microbacterium sp.]
MAQKRRSDAQDNRRRILAAARSLLTTQSLDVTMRAVARAAGVGPATLYRHFPTKQDLIEAVFDENVRACERIVADGLADPDPVRGFTQAVTGLVVHNLANRGFVEAFMATVPDRDWFAAHRRRLLAQLMELAGRAQARGTLRRDLTASDLVLALLAVRGLSALPRDQRDAAARRYAELTLDAFRASSHPE